MNSTPYYRVDAEHSGELGREVWILGPPGCLAGPTRIAINRAGKGSQVRIDHLVACANGGKPSGRGARLWDPTIPTYVQRAVGDTIRLGRLLHAWESGVKPVRLVATEGGRSIAATDEHPFLTTEGWAKLGDLRTGDGVVVNAGQGRGGRGPRKRYASTYTRFHPRQRRGNGGWRVPTHRLVAEATLNGLGFAEYLQALRLDAARSATFTYLTPDQTVHHRNHDHTDNRPENLQILDGGQAEHAAEHGWGDNVLYQTGVDRIVSVKPVGEVPTYDLEVADDPHCFVANGFVVHNTGKTTFLAGSVKNTTLLRGRDSVAICSFTTAAAAEIGGRDTGLHHTQYGTLHSMAKRSLGGDNIVYLEQLADWNTHHPGWALKGEKRNLDDPGAPAEAIGGGADGDSLMTSCENYRSKLVPRDHWPSAERTFFAAWDDWKQANGLIDFTDMIELALTDTEVAPGRPDVLFADEVQDFTPLELALVRKWGRHAERLVLAGDDDQSIYHFRGAVPEAWLDQPVADSDKIVLSQSWRIPASVHRTAEHWIRKLDRREEKLYKPRDEEGLVRALGVTFKQQHMLADEIEKSLDTVDSEGKPATVMVLAPCAYMVEPIVRELKERGVPFSNPWQRRRGDWNPFPPMGGKNTSSRERLLAYLSLDERAFPSGVWHRPEGWTGDDIRRWAHTVKKRGIFARGAAAALEALPIGPVPPEDVMALFADEVEMEQAVTPDLEWLERNLTAGSRNGMLFPLEVARKRGPAALLAEPRVHVGTMHSFKGAQATVVYLIPDLSKMFMNDWRERGPGKDAIRRLFYVGMTRARRELAVLAPAERFHVEQHSLVAGSKVVA